MRTFEQFLEDIRDKLGPYTGDPLQIMAAKDIEEEEGSSKQDLMHFFVGSIIELMDKILLVSEKSESLYYFSRLLKTARNEFDKTQQDQYYLRDAFRSTILAFRSLNTIPPEEASYIKQDLDNLRGMITRLRQTQDLFAKHGIDHKMRTLTLRLMRTNHTVDASNASIEYVLQNLHRDKFSSVLSRWAADAYTSTDCKECWDKLFKAVNTKEFYDAANDRTKYIMDQIRKRLKEIHAHV